MILILIPQADIDQIKWMSEDEKFQLDPRQRIDGDYALNPKILSNEDLMHSIIPESILLKLQNYSQIEMNSSDFPNEEG